MSKKKIPTSNEEIQALKARIAELEQKAEDEIKAFVSSIRDALKAAKVEAPGECTLTVQYAEAGAVPTISYRVGGRSSRPRKNGVRDSRLPKPGDTITKEYRGQTHDVEFTEGNGVKMDGQMYGTVSAAAKALTGTATNGYAFFGLDK